MIVSFSVEDRIDPGHPSLPGHFPGQPIVPGVLLLSRVMAAIEQHAPQVEVIGARKIRFHAPLLPGEIFLIHARDEGDASVRFDVERQGERIASGTFSLRGGAMDAAGA